MLEERFQQKKIPKHTIFPIAFLQRKLTLKASKKIKRQINNKNNATAFF